MHENQQDGDGYNISYTKYVEAEIRLAIGGFPVGKLLSDDSLRGAPSHKNARQQGASW